MRSEDELSIQIESTEFRFWASASVKMSLDSPGAVEFTAPFDPTDQAQRDLFQPFSYRPVQVFLGPRRIFTGIMVDVAPRQSPASTTVTITAYDRFGLLGDVSPPPELFPLEFVKLNIDQIAQRLIEPFGLTPQFADERGAVFDKVKMAPTQNIFSFLVGLAKQRGLVIGSGSDGNPLFQKAAPPPKAPRAKLNASQSPVISVSASFTPQAYYSEITGISKTKSGRAGSQFTVHNDFLAGGGRRPLIYELSDTEPADVPSAVNAKLGRMFGNAASYDVELATMHDPNGNLWEANTYVSLLAPNAMVYTDTLFLVRSATLKPNPKSKTATLNLVLPGSFGGDLPEVLPWVESV